MLRTSKRANKAGGGPYTTPENAGRRWPDSSSETRRSPNSRFFRSTASDCRLWAIPSRRTRVAHVVPAFPLHELNKKHGHATLRIRFDLPNGSSSNNACPNPQTFLVEPMSAVLIAAITSASHSPPHTPSGASLET